MQETENFALSDDLVTGTSGVHRPMGSGNLAKEPAKKQPDEVVLEAFREVGQVLADARKEKNLTIWQVAAQIHIRQQYLVDLEEGRLYDLPGRVYILGFIRTYARLLELDGEELVRRVSTMPNLPDYARSQVPIPMNAEEEPNFPILVLSALFIVCLATGGYFFLKPSSNSTSEKDFSPGIIQPQEQEKAIQANSPLEGNSSDQPLEAPVAVVPQSIPKLLVLKEETLAQKSAQLGDNEKDIKDTVPSSKKITLKAKEPSWVEIRDEGGRVFFMRVLQRGEEFVVPDKPGAVFNTGNAGGIDIFVGDQKLPPLGARGDVKRGIRLDTLHQ